MLFKDILLRVDNTNGKETKCTLNGYNLSEPFEHPFVWPLDTYNPIGSPCEPDWIPQFYNFLPHQTHFFFLDILAEFSFYGSSLDNNGALHHASEPIPY